MHDFYHDKLLEDATKFDSRAGNTFVEILDSGVHERCCDKSMREADINFRMVLR